MPTHHPPDRMVEPNGPITGGPVGDTALRWAVLYLACVRVRVHSKSSGVPGQMVLARRRARMIDCQSTRLYVVLRPQAAHALSPDCVFHDGDLPPQGQRTILANVIRLSPGVGVGGSTGCWLMCRRVCWLLVVGCCSPAYGSEGCWLLAVDSVSRQVLSLCFLLLPPYPPGGESIGGAPRRSARCSSFRDGNPYGVARRARRASCSLLQACASVTSYCPEAAPRVQARYSVHSRSVGHCPSPCV